MEQKKIKNFKKIPKLYRSDSTSNKIITVLLKIAEY